MYVKEISLGMSNLMSLTLSEMSLDSQYGYQIDQDTYTNVSMVSDSCQTQFSKPYVYHLKFFVCTICQKMSKLSNTRPQTFQTCIFSTKTIISHII